MRHIPVVILGAGGYARLCYEILSAQSDVHILGCTDKTQGLSEVSVSDGHRLPILGDDDILPSLKEQNPDLHAVLALGPALMAVRRRLINQLVELAIPPVGGVHPSAFVSDMATVGRGSMIGAGVTISGGCQIGQHCTVVIGATFDHDTTLGDNVLISQGANISSYVTIGDHVIVEMGANINNRVTIGDGARVMAGAFVNTDVPENTIVAGIPARVIRVDGN